MSRCSTRYWKVAPAILLVLLAFIPAASAQGGLFPSPATEICGRVVNEVGWGLEGVEVRAVGTGFVSAGHLPAPTTSTTEEGSFSLGIVHDTYTLVFVDSKSPDERAGAAYQPRIENVDASSFEQLTEGGCDGPEQRYAVELDHVVLPAEGSEFFLADVTDEVDDRPLEGAQVVVEVPDLELNLEWGGSPTDKEGVAQLSCPSGLPFRLRVEKADYQSSLFQEHDCGPGIGTIELKAWRKAIPIAGTAIDHDTGESLAGATITAIPLDLNLTEGPGYTLNTDSADNGSWSLAVPWGGQYTIEATKAGYGPDDRILEVDPTPPLPFDLRLPRRQIVFSGQVVDVQGDGVRATMEFDGPQATGEETDGDGNFSFELPFGEYDITITSAGKNTRTCDVQLPVDEDGPVLDPAHCLVLIGDGKAAVEGVVLDGPTQGPVEGASVTIGTDSVTTGTDGGFIIEADWQAEEYTIVESAYDTKTDSVPIPRQDTFVDLGEVPLDRKRIDVTFQTLSDDGPLEGVELTASGAAGTGACTSNPSGECTIELPWTTRGDSHTDESGYDITGKRLSAAPLFDQQVCANDEHVDFDSPAITCPLEVVAALSTFVEGVVDAHDNQTVEGVDVIAVPVGLDDGPAAAACSAPYACTAATGPEGTATLLLPEGRSFDLTIEDDRYQTVSVTDLLAGESVNSTGLLRAHASVRIDLYDAHTQRAIEGADLQAHGEGFVCDPTAQGPCEATTNTTGAAILQLPWGEHLVNVPAGAYTVQGLNEETGVRFQAANRSLTVLASGDQVDQNESFGLLRAPGATIFGIVTDHEGGEVPDARMHVNDVRGDGFECNPEGTGIPFPDCSGLHVSGAYNLTLPHGTHEHHRWDLEVVHDDHHREDRLVDPGAEQDILLWPLDFDLTVEVRDQQTNELLNFVDVCIKNLDRMATTDLFAFDCPGQTGAEPVPVVFEDVTWIREDAEDTTDAFLVSAARSQYPEQYRVVELGPAEDTLILRLQRVPPHAPDPEPPRPARIHGSVEDIDAALADGVTGLRLSAERTQGPCRDGLDSYETASVGGSYELLVGCPGEYLVAVEDPLGRYQATQADVTVPAGAPLLGPLHELGETRQNFQLERSVGALEAQVLDAAGLTGVEGATVTITGADVTFLAGPESTNGQGLVRFEGIPWGTYQVSAQADEAQWIVSSGTSVGHVPPGGEGNAVVVLVGLEAELGCQVEGGPQVCPAQESDSDVALLSLQTTGGEAGAWSVVQPQIGQISTAVDADSLEPLAGPHDGTWVVVFQPTPEPGATEDIEVSLSFTSDQTTEETLTATTALAASVGPLPVHSPLVWIVNLQTGSQTACLPLQNECPGADPAHAAESRFFLPG